MELQIQTWEDQNLLLEEKLPESKKGKLWSKAHIDYMIRNSTFISNTFNTKDVNNINLAKGIIDATDFKYVTNPYGLKDKSMPAELMNFNPYKGKKRVLVGEESTRPFNWTVLCTNEDTTSTISDKMSDMLDKKAQQDILRTLMERGTVGPQINKLTGEPIIPQSMSLDDIHEYIGMSFKQKKEVIANRSLKYIIKYCNLEYEFNEGFNWFLDTNKEVYSIRNISNEPTITRVNTSNFYCAVNPASPWVEDSDWCIELRMMQPADVYDEYHGKLSDETIKEVETYRHNMAGNYAPWVAGTVGTGDPVSPLTYVQSVDFSGRDRRNQALIPVFRCIFHSLKQIGYLRWVDDNHIIQEDVVDGTFKVIEPAQYDRDTGELIYGQEVEWDWINELREATKIGATGYVDMGPIESSYSSMDNLSRCPLPYTGYFSDDPSLTEDAKPYIYFYLIIFYRLQLAFASDRGKVMLMDITQIPKKYGWNIEKWLYYLDAMKIMFVDPYSEGWIKRGNKPAAFNQFTAEDLSLGNSINMYISALDKIDDMLSNMTGITRQRQGEISSSETVGGVERSITQSSHITEWFFMIHNEVKRRTLSAALEISKECWKHGKKIHYFDDELGRVSYEIDGDEYSNGEYDLFVSGSKADWSDLQTMKSLVKELISSGKGTLSDAVSVIRSTSMAEVANRIKTSENKAIQNQMQTEQATLQNSKDIATMKTNLEMAKLQMADANNRRTNDTLDTISQRENDTKLIIASKPEDIGVDATDNTAIESAKIGLKNQEMNDKKQMFNVQQDNEMKKHNDDVILRKREIASKNKTQK